ncbi:MAG: NYN domain-containing protein [Ignavibacterium album]|uniref:NYN domain-containing protein n=1 Tax=Ignavibacterium album TaxID=591197 RepID=UPI0026F2175C|nr:NYN domain-containing protein [Ignavibacterium album]MBI5662186.1 NYN domain-containing protein [Ignavibacterium album]
MRTIIYIDGFNYHYRAVKKSPFKWLDFKSLFTKILSSNHQITQIKYFTALVSGKYNASKPLKQQVYLRALQTYITEIKIYYGHFLTHEVFPPSADPADKNKSVKIIKTEEKGSDVNIAVHLLNDAWLNEYDCGLIVSNDSDLAESMKLVRKYHPTKILGLVMPGKGHPSKELMKYATFIKRIREGVLRDSQLPDPIPGTNISKPVNW